jgi:hypothetical protein
MTHQSDPKALAAELTWSNDPAWKAQRLAEAFHAIYERLAPSFGYETRAETRAFKPASPNGKLMIAVCAEILASLPPSQPSELPQERLDTLERIAFEATNEDKETPLFRYWFRKGVRLGYSLSPQPSEQAVQVPQGTEPVQVQPLSDQDIASICSKQGITFYVPDDSDRHLWTRLDTEDIRRLKRAFERAFCEANGLLLTSPDSSGAPASPSRSTLQPAEPASASIVGAEVKFVDSVEAAKFWAKVFPCGITDEQLKAELSDYHFMLGQVPKVYDHVTGGLLTKTNYYASVVIGAADDYMNSVVERELVDAGNARGMEARSGETEGLDPEGATARSAEPTRPETQAEDGEQGR